MNKDQFLRLMKAWADTRNDDLMFVLEDELETLYGNCVVAYYHQSVSAKPSDMEKTNSIPRNAKKTVILEKIGTGETKEFPSINSASEWLGVDKASVSNAANGIQNTVKGYTAKFK